MPCFFRLGPPGHPGGPLWACPRGRYAQRKGIDYEETFAPVGKLETFRYLAQVANSKDWNLRQIDFKNAFLNAPMDKELYMELPPGGTGICDGCREASEGNGV